MVLIIDHYDSFTYNLVQIIAAQGLAHSVVQYDRISIDDISRLKPDKIILSPGPGRPDPASVSVAAVQTFSGTIPILGICLGHQCIGLAFGSGMKRAARMLHGKTATLWHDETGLFRDIPNPVAATRYHSLVIASVPSEFILTAWDRAGDIMAIRHRSHPTIGLQFHPESFLMPEGEKIVLNFLQLEYDRISL
ncbi:MAG: anthranilate synthase component II [Fidelibacterota bacterium]